MAGVGRSLLGVKMISRQRTVRQNAVTYIDQTTINRVTNGAQTVFFDHPHHQDIIEVKKSHLKTSQSVFNKLIRMEIVCCAKILLWWHSAYALCLAVTPPIPWLCLCVTLFRPSRHFSSELLLLTELYVVFRNGFLRFYNVCAHLVTAKSPFWQASRFSENV